MYARSASGPGANVSQIGVGDAADVMLTVIRDALAGAHPQAIAIGAAGAGSPGLAGSLADLIGSAYPHARVDAGDDARIALRSAIPEGPGIVLISGTGSVAYAENGERRARAGGAGYLLGDEGSAFAIGMAAVKLYARVFDGRATRDETTDLVARAFDAHEREQLIAAIYGAPLQPARVAALAPSIIAFAGKGNRASTKIVQQAGLDLAELVRTVARAVDLTSASPSVALSGGLLRENSLLSFLLETRLVGDLPGIAILRGGDAPEIGALRLAEAALA